MISSKIRTPEKTQSHAKKTPNNTSFWRRIWQALIAFDIMLHKRRTWGEVGCVLREYWGVRIIKKFGNFFTKKRSLRDMWRGCCQGICDICTEQVPEEVPPPKNWFQKYQYRIWDGIMLVCVYIFLFSGLKMEWILRDIIPIGGDVPYHVANYFDLKEILLPHFQISGWSDASFAGFQLFQAYPIFPFLLIYLLDIFIGSGVAFKIVLILGAVGLPLATYWTLFQSRIPRPGPIFGAILSLAYLYHDDHFAFGGNLRSVFSGEFAHSLSILLLVIFSGFLFKAFENKKYAPHAIITLALVGFSHPISFAVAIFLPLGFIIGKKTIDTTEWLPLSFFQRNARAFRIMLIGGLLFCTWAIGFYVNKKYASLGTHQVIGQGYGWGITFHYLIPKLLLPFGILFLVQIVYYCFQWKKLSQIQIVFLWGFLVSLGFFLFQFMGFAIRFLPLIYLFVMLFIAATIGRWYTHSKREIIHIGICCLMIAGAAFIFYFVDNNNLFQRYRGTSGHNFIGAESRSEWKSVQLTSDFLSKNFDSQTDKPTLSYPPRIFSYFKGDLFRVTSKASMYDSLFSSSLFTTQGISTGRKIDKKEISVEQFWKYMDLSNTKIVVGPKELSETLETSPNFFKYLRTFDQYKVFETRNTSRSYVVPLRTEVYAIHELSDWKKTSEKWYQQYSEKSPFIVYEPDTTQTRFTLYDPKKSQHKTFKDDCQVREMVSRERIKIYTNCINRPLLIKFAYHQNWQVTGADKVYLATPAFMIVVPHQNDVTLYYGKRPYNYVAYVCGILGLLLFFTYNSIENSLWNHVQPWTKKQKALLRRVERKFGIGKKGTTLLIISTPIICILILLASIAFVYVNKG